MIKLIKRRGFKVSLSIILILILSAALFNILNNGKDIKNTEDFINEFTTKGYKIEERNILFGWEPFSKYNGKRNVMKINNVSIEYYDFKTEDEAKVAAQTISKDGMSFGGGKIKWDGNPPRFYRKGNVIVMYEGTDLKVLWDLRTVIGKSIAGTPIHTLLRDKANKLIQNIAK